MTTPAAANTAARPVGRSFVAAPAPKCKSCSKSVYPMEKIEYDGQVFHQECFKCLKCKTRVVLVNVAMIKGDLYCKNCFKKVFGEKGKYDSFGEKTQAKWTADHKKSVDVGRPSAAGAPVSTPASTTPALSTVPEKRSGSNAAPAPKKEEPKPAEKKEEPKPEPVVEKQPEPEPTPVEETKQPEPVAEPAATEQAPAPVEEPAATPAETPAESAPTEAAAPADVPAEAPAEVPAEAPAEVPAEAPAEVPAEAAPAEVSA